MAGEAFNNNFPGPESDKWPQKRKISVDLIDKATWGVMSHLKDTDIALKSTYFLTLCEKR